jgi:ribonucleoside-diphosphate reductase alpha chain
VAEALDTPIARHVWETRYCADAMEISVQATWRRVAHALAQAETANRNDWEQRFLDILRDFQFVPGGRILAGAGTQRDVTMFNCFVMGTIEDSIPGIFRALEEGAITMQRGGGVGYDFSTIRPSGAHSRTTGTIASGPVSFMDIWDTMCATIQSTGARRGAMMATLRCDHPDMASFIEAKRQPGRLRHFNLSVLVTDAFMRAIERDGEWTLGFPSCRVVQRVSARQLWDRLLHAAYDTGEPGVLFIDRINRDNNLWYCEQIAATNPCGEIPLPPYGACDLGSLNLSRFIRAPFTPEAGVDMDRLVQVAGTAVRLLDNAIELSRFPLPQQDEAVRKTRRIGLGVTGLADALIMLGLRYGSDASLCSAGEVMRTVCCAAYRQSIELAREKAGFPALDTASYLKSPFVQALPEDIRQGVARHGIRNSHLLAVAPAGTISLLAGNVSSGIEPVFAADQDRTVLNVHGKIHQFRLSDYAVRLWRQRSGRCDELPNALVTAQDLTPEAHIDMQAALQPYVDNSISKTINVPMHTSFNQFAPLYQIAYRKGLKGCTTFRAGATAGAVIAVPEQPSLGSGPCEECEG